MYLHTTPTARLTRSNQTLVISYTSYNDGSGIGYAEVHYIMPEDTEANAGLLRNIRAAVTHPDLDAGVNDFDGQPIKNAEWLSDLAEHSLKIRRVMR